MAKVIDKPKTGGFSSTVRRVIMDDGDLISQIYEGATYTFICLAPRGTALNTANWKVARVHNIDGSRRYAEGNEFDNLATDLATVQALTYE